MELEMYDTRCATLSFFCHGWFTRVWVLQEIVLAQQAIIMWGEHSISWTCLGSAIEAIRSNQLLHWLLDSRCLQNAFYMWHLSKVHHELEAFETDSQQVPDGEKLPLLHFLDLGRGFRATDPRDKIYGLLGFPTSDDGLGASSIIPDYTLSAREVYTQITRDFIEKDANLYLMGLIVFTPPDSSQADERMEDLPSWVPDFNSGTTIFPMSSINKGQQYSAGLSKPLHVLTHASPHTLRLEGVVLDTIRATSC